MMKKLTLSLSAMILLGTVCSAQYINWNSLNPEKRNSVSMNLGYDYGLTLGAGYNRSLNLWKPVLLGIEFSAPMGDQLFDDYKIRIGGEIDLLKINDFHFSAKAKGIVRRYQSENLRIENFGSDFGLTAGYYRSMWYLAVETGFDKAITSYLEHSDRFKDNYPQSQDGWYLPTGGQFYYGLSTGFSLKKVVDINLKLGVTNAQGKHVNALLPYYLQLGLSRQF